MTSGIRNLTMDNYRLVDYNTLWDGANTIIVHDFYMKISNNSPARNLSYEEYTALLQSARQRIAEELKNETRN